MNFILNWKVQSENVNDINIETLSLNLYNMYGKLMFMGN